VISKLENDMDMFEEWYKARTEKIKEYTQKNTVGMGMMMAVQKELANVLIFTLIFI
jgi:hypothetical protein